MLTIRGDGSHAPKLLLRKARLKHLLSMDLALPLGGRFRDGLG